MFYFGSGSIKRYVWENIYQFLLSKNTTSNNKALLWRLISDYYLFIQAYLLKLAFLKLIFINKNYEL